MAIRAGHDRVGLLAAFGQTKVDASRQASAGGLRVNSQAFFVKQSFTGQEGQKVPMVSSVMMPSAAIHVQEWQFPPVAAKRKDIRSSVSAET